MKKDGTPVTTEIYYFSGTGNTLHVSEELQKRLPDSTCIPSHRQSQKHSNQNQRRYGGDHISDSGIYTADKYLQMVGFEQKDRALTDEKRKNDGSRAEKNWCSPKSGQR